MNAAVTPTALVSAVPPAGIKLIWETGVRLCDAQLREASAIDGKVAPLLGFTAAAIGLALGQHQALGDAALPVGLELLVVFVFLLLSFRVQAFRNPPDYAQFIRWAREDEDRIREAFLGNLRAA